MKCGVSKTKVTSFSRETKILICDYKHCLSSTNGTDSLKDLEYFFIINFIFISTSTIQFLIVLSC
jgi:chloramphenicol O-acetyltransferase